MRTRTPAGRSASRRPATRRLAAARAASLRSASPGAQIAATVAGWSAVPLADASTT
jgi:hypothetical protein